VRGMNRRHTTKAIGNVFGYPVCDVCEHFVGFYY
jgi:hypothetical protein